MKRNTVTAFLSVAGSRFAIIVASVFVTPLLFRFLGSAKYGEWGTVMAVFSLLMIFISAGIGGGARKFLSESRPDPDWEEHVFAYYFRLAGVLALLAAGGLVAAAQTGLVAATLGPKYESYFYILAVLALFAQFRAYVRLALMGLKLEHVSEPIRVAHKILFGVSAVSLAWLGYGVKGVLFGEIIASAGVILLASIALARHLSLSYVLRPLPSEFPRWELFAFNHNSIAYHFMMTSLVHVDVLMLGYFLANSDTVGVYKGALVIVQLLWILPRSVQSVMVQAVSDHWANDRVEKINAIAQRVVRYTTLLSILLSVGLAALAWDFVPLYLGEEGARAVWPVLLLIPGTLSYAIGRPVFAISYAKDDMRVLIIATGIAAGLNVVLNAVLIPVYGMYGAAIATSIGYTALPLAHVWGARELGYQPFGDFRAPRILATALLGTLPIVALSLAIHNSLLALLVVPPVGLLAFALATLLTGAIYLSEIVDLLDSLPGPAGTVASALRPYAASNRSGAAVLYERMAGNGQALLSVGLVMVFLVGAGLVVGMPSDSHAPAGAPVNSTADRGPLPTTTQKRGVTTERVSTPSAGTTSHTQSLTSKTTPETPTPTPTSVPTPTTTPTTVPTPTPTPTTTPTTTNPTPTPAPTTTSPIPTPTPAPTTTSPIPTPTPAPTTTSPTPTPTPTPTPAPTTTSPTPTPTPTSTTTTTTPTPTPVPTTTSTPQLTTPPPTTTESTTISTPTTTPISTTTAPTTTNTTTSSTTTTSFTTTSSPTTTTTNTTTPEPTTSSG